MLGEQRSERGGTMFGGGKPQVQLGVRRDRGATVLGVACPVRESQHQQVDPTLPAAQKFFELDEQGFGLAQHDRCGVGFEGGIAAGAEALARHMGTAWFRAETGEPVEIRHRRRPETARKTGAWQTLRSTERAHPDRLEAREGCRRPTEHRDRQRRQRTDQSVARQHSDTPPRPRQRQCGKGRRRERPPRREPRLATTRQHLRTQRSRTAEQAEAATHLEQHSVRLEAHAWTEADGELREALEIGHRDTLQREPRFGCHVEQRLERRRLRRAERRAERRSERIESALRRCDPLTARHARAPDAQHRRMIHCDAIRPSAARRAHDDRHDF